MTSFWRTLYGLQQDSLILRPQIVGIYVVLHRRRAVDLKASYAMKLEECLVVAATHLVVITAYNHLYLSFVPPVIVTWKGIMDINLEWHYWARRRMLESHRDSQVAHWFLNLANVLVLVQPHASQTILLQSKTGISSYLDNLHKSQKPFLELQ